MLAAACPYYNYFLSFLSNMIRNPRTEVIASSLLVQEEEGKKKKNTSAGVLIL